MGMALVLSDVQSTISADKPVAVVTGANGFIGRHLCRMLQSAGYFVKAMVRSNRHLEREELFADQLRAIELNDSRLSSVFTGAEVVFHLAGIAHTGVRDDKVLQKVNVLGARSVAMACKTAGVKRLIHFSSILAQDPEQSAYANSKFEGEQAVLTVANDGLAAVILRPVSVYGPGMQGNWYNLIRRIASKRMPPLPRLSNQLDLVSVENLCQAAILFAESDITAADPTHTHVVTDARQYSPNEIESAIYETLGRKNPAWATPRVLFFAAAVVADFAGKLRILHSGFGLGSYRNLVRDSIVSPDALKQLQEAIAYQPRQTLTDVLPEMVAAIENEK